MMRKLFTTKSATRLATACLALTVGQLSAQFTSGNVVVLQAGDGSSALANTGNAIVLREFTPTGTAGYSMAIPTSSATGLSILGNSTAEGLMTLSSNGQYLVIPGYAGTFTSNIVSTTGTVVPRCIGTVDAAGTYTRVASSNSFFSAGNIRSAVSDGAGNFWANGSNQGTNYFGNTTTPSNIQAFVTNNRAFALQGGDMAFSTGSGTRGIYVVNTIGSGTTTVPASTITLVVPTGATSSPYQFAIAPTLTYGYVADDNATTAGGGIQKWVFNGFTWSLAYTFATSTNTAITAGARGLTVDFSGPNPIIYATTSETSSNRLISIVDAGSLATSTITTLATASTANTIFRGVAFAPSSGCTTPSITAIGSNAPICSGQPLMLSSSATGTGPLTYSWFGTGTFSTSSTIASPTVTGAASGDYTLAVVNSCGTATAVVNVTVTPNPTVSVNAASICSGGTATLTATGATTYSWNTGASTNSISVNPTSTTVYTVTGYNGSCSSATTTTVTVTASPTLAVNSTSICAGSTATLTASGVSTYTWTSPVSNNASITVSPSATTVYTVSGNAAGCAGTFSATGTVSVTALPSLTVTPSSASVCAGQASTLTVSGVTSQTWAPGGQTAASVVVTPTATTVYTVTGSNSVCSNMQTVNVTVNPLPTVSASSATICAGKTASLTATGTAATYTWMPGSVSGVTYTVSPAVGLNTYTVTGTSAAGCTKSATGSVVVAPNPTVTASASSSVICAGSTVSLTASGATSYVWSNGVANGAGFTPTVTASYTVTGTSAVGGCTNTAVTSVTVNTCIGIKEHTNGLVMDVYPNPSNGNFTIASSVFPATLIVVDVTGKEVLKKEITERETTVNVSALNNGIYYISVIAETGSARYKVVIAK